MEGVHHLSQEDKHPWLLLNRGRYVLDSNASSFFSGPQIRDFGIIGHAEESTRVECSQNAGMKFVNVEKITFTNVTFLKCGTVQPSTSVRNRSQPVEFKVGLYFLLCSDLTFSRVSMNNSDGVAILVYSSGGNNLFELLNVFDSKVDSEQQPAAGGLHIEFCYCVPGNCSTVVHNSQGKVANASYLIVNSMFVGNLGSIHKRELGISTPHGIRHLSLGCGGGVSLAFKGEAFNNSVVISSSIFAHNKAVWGGGLFISHQDNSTTNTVTISQSNFVSNQAQAAGGGGAWVEFIFHGNDRVENNSVTFHECKFELNSANQGGGVGFNTARESMLPHATNSLDFVNCSWFNNTAQSGAAVDLGTCYSAAEGSTVTVKFLGRTEFCFNGLKELVPGTLAVLGTLVTDSVPVEFETYVEFSGNLNTALAAFGTPLYFKNKCIANFTDNRGLMGGAISLYNFAYIEVGEDTQFIFKSNTAEFRGGAICVTSDAIHDVISSGSCFVRYYDTTVQPDEWMTKFLFEDNVAMKKSNAIYATTVSSCSWGYAQLEDSDMENVPFCWHDWTYKQNHSDVICISQIETDPTQFNDTCPGSVSLNVYPGERKQLPSSLRMFDDYGHMDNNMVLVTSTSNKGVVIVDRYVSVSDNTIKIVGAPNTTDVIVGVYTMGPKVVYSCTLNSQLPYQDVPLDSLMLKTAMG